MQVCRSTEADRSPPESNYVRGGALVGRIPPEVDGPDLAVGVEPAAPSPAPEVLGRLGAQLPAGDRRVEDGPRDRLPPATWRAGQLAQQPLGGPPVGQHGHRGVAQDPRVGGRVSHPEVVR